MEISKRAHMHVHVMCLRILVELNQICKSVCGVSLLNFWQARQRGNSGQKNIVLLLLSQVRRGGDHN